MTTRAEYLAQHATLARLLKAGNQHDLAIFFTNHPIIARDYTNATARQATPVPVAAGPAAAAAAATSPTGLAALSAGDRDWVDELTALFKKNGLEALAGTLTGLVQNNYSGSALTLALQDSDAYKTRFSANEARKKAGLPVLSPAEYLANENGYRDAMFMAGLPAGFYDDPSDYAKFLSEGTSVAEVQARVQAHLDIAKKTDPAYRKMLQDTFGIGLTDGDIAAFSLDSARALPLLQREVNSVGIADAARRNGLGYSAGRADALAQAGVTGSQADQSYGAIAEQTAAESRAASAFGLDYSQTDAEDESLLGLASAKRKRQNVEGAFTAYNSGSSTSAKGANAKDTSGSY